MAQQTEYKIKHQAYSTIPFVRDKQNDRYIEIIEKEIDKILNGDYTTEETKQKLTQLLEDVYIHQKLEKKPVPSKLVKRIQADFKKTWRGNFEFKPSQEVEQALKLPIEVNKYSILPKVKAKQMTLNRDMMKEAAKIFKLGPDELVWAYKKELDRARTKGCRPRKTIISAISKRKLELQTQTQRAMTNFRTRSTEGDRNYEMLSFNVKGASTYSKDPKVRELELKSQYMIVDFCRFETKESCGVSDTLKRIKEDLNDKSIEKYEAYIEYLKSRKTVLEYEWGERTAKTEDVINRAIDEVNEKEKRVALAVYGKPGETYEAMMERRAAEDEKRKLNEARKSREADLERNYGDSIYDAGYASRLNDRTEGYVPDP